MARYYFHLQDGEYLADEVGLDLHGMDEVRSEAIRSGAEIIRDYALDGWSGTEWRMNVVDEAGRTVFNLLFLRRRLPTRFLLFRRLKPKRKTPAQ